MSLDPDLEQYSKMTLPSEADFTAARRRRIELVQQSMDQSYVDALVLTLGADMPWLIGYEAMPLERVTALVMPRGGRPTLVVPKLEAPRVRHFDDMFSIEPWAESEDPFSLIADLVGTGAGRVGVSERTWASWLIRLQSELPNTTYIDSSEVTGDVRSVKDDIEIMMLRLAAEAADRVADALMAGFVTFKGRSERQISKLISEMLVDEGHSKVNFAIVGSGPNSASPHHEPGDRVIEFGDAVVCDFGGTFGIHEEPGYCSDTTRTFCIGEADQEFLRLYDVLHRAQLKSTASAISGVDLSAVDAAARDEIDSEGFGEYFVHRVGHGIGLEEHELPYLAPHSVGVLKSGHAFSVEPGIYLPGRFGARIEDIVVATDDGPQSLNVSNRSLVCLDR